MTQIDTSPEAIAALMDGVTPGPWEAVAAGQADDLNEVVAYKPTFSSIADAEGANARFIAAARDLVPALAARLAEVEAERDQIIEAKTNWNVRANDMEARAEAAEAALKEAAWLLGAQLKDPDYDEWAERKAAFLSKHGGA